MTKQYHEVRDPVHNFIRYDSNEKMVIDSIPFQRLRNIHQLALTYMVYPGATHRRFEHSIGVMDVADKIFCSITQNDKIDQLPREVRDNFSLFRDNNEREYWRRVLRAAALCHDLGHLPFSHAAEKELLPEGVSHETMTKTMVLSEEMQAIWNDYSNPKPKPEDIVKIAVGPKEAKEYEFTLVESLISEIITSDVFGADRIDYLLRDSLHSGVKYGQFDHHRLINTLMILPDSPQDKSQEYSVTPSLGIELGGLQVAESLLVARYLLFSQVLLHHVRRIYDIHLKEFMMSFFKDGLPIEYKDFIHIDDNFILSMISEISRDKNHRCFDSACAIYHRNHYKKIFQGTKDVIEVVPLAVEKVAEELVNEFGSEHVKSDPYFKETAVKRSFSVLMEDRRYASSLAVSEVITALPPSRTNFVFVSRDVYEDACKWRKKKLDAKLAEWKEED